MSKAAPMLLTQEESDLLAGALGLALTANGFASPELGFMGAIMFQRAYQALGPQAVDELGARFEAHEAAIATMPAGVPN